MANEALAWPSPPSSTDLDDGAQAYNMGVLFSIVAGTDCPGVQWRVPDTVSTPPGGTHAISIWNDDTVTRVAYKEFTPVPGGYQDILFDAPVSLSSGVNYVAAVYTVHYTFRAVSPSGVTTPSGNGVAAAGRLTAYNGGAANVGIPDGTFTATYYISPLLVTSDTTPEGQAAVGVGLAVAAVGGRTSAGAADVGLGLALDARGSATRQGVAAVGVAFALNAAGATTHAGAAAVGLNLAVAATGQAPGVAAANGVAALTLGLAVAAAGARNASGAAAVGLNLAVAAAGQGQASRGPGPWLTSANRPNVTETRHALRRIVTATQVAT